MSVLTHVFATEMLKKQTALWDSVELVYNKHDCRMEHVRML